MMKQLCCKYNIFYSDSKAETAITESDIDDVFESICVTTISNIQTSLGGSSWIIDSAIDHIINISECNVLAGRGYTKLPKKLNHSKKALINFQNIDDNEFFKSYLVRYLHPADHNLWRITKSDKLIGDKLGFFDDKFSKSLKFYKGKHAVYNLIKSLIEESKFCTDIMKKHFNKELMMTKWDHEDFQNCTNFWICDHTYVEGDLSKSSLSYHWKI